MRQKGSVLVVVLGLLAILAVIGVAFLTMSSLERSTATSFALQTQMTIAADGAIEYAIYPMVLDVWEYYTIPPEKITFTGKLLTGGVAGVRDPANPTRIYAACEPYDYPSAAADPWLSAPIVSNATPTWISFGNLSGSRFGIKFGSLVTGPDNLGFPVAAADRKANGIWPPDLVAPCDQYLVRASVTILDHNALVNLNAHGSKDTGAWEYGDCIGKGYFVSDAVPPVTGLDDLLFGAGAVPGCWGNDGPGNAKTGAVLIENPAAEGTGLDVPYTLDEEFELRNLWGTYFQSRLEQFWPALLSDPANASVSGYTRRLKTTTVSWTAEVRGDLADLAASHAIMKDAAGADQGWSAAKVDLNTASADDIYKALLDGRAMDDGGELKQFAANIVTLRRKDPSWDYRNIVPVSVGGTNYLGAVRQPVLSEATCSPPVLDETDPLDIKRTYTIKVEAYNPWPGSYNGDPLGKLRTDVTVAFDVNAGHTVLPTSFQSLSLYTLGDACCTPIVERQIVCHNNATLKNALKSIRLHWGNPTWSGKILDLDLITGDGDNTNVATLETTGRIYRKVDFVDEYRGTKNNSPIRIFYVSDWNSGGGANLGTATKDTGLRNSAIPIRFLNCVSLSATSLPVRAGGAADFKAFARVGDLNQVLRFLPGPDPAGRNTWWREPWICTVSKKSRIQENDVKFDWTKDINNVAAGTGSAAAYAANVLSVGGPWNDGLDNDGDTQLDFADKGTGTGQPGGPEFRVAGKINLNTAITETLTALGLASLPAKPIKSPAQILTGAAMTNAGLEARDELFSRISNIATVRSDTFSIYGTVQIVDPSRAQKAANTTIDMPEDIIRTRQFWALVDRSPSLAYPPTDSANFIRPRILNFQWLD